MKRFLWPVTVLLTNGLGRCPTCMRISFLAALLSWVLAAMAFAVTHEGLVHLAASALAAGFTLLWFAHLAAFAWRSTRAGIRRLNRACDAPVLPQRRSVL